MGEWSSQRPLPIACRELFPVVVASHLWGHRWAAKCVEFCSDNMVVVGVLCLGTSRGPGMVVLLHSLSLIAAHHSFAFTASHGAGGGSCMAGALSHLGFQHFHHLAPHAAPSATPVPPWLLAQLPVIWWAGAISAWLMAWVPPLIRCVAPLNTSSNLGIL